MVIFNLGCIFLHFLLLIFLEREDLITYVTSLVILMLDIHFCGILLIAANVLPSYGILVTISRETGCCFRSCDVSTHIINTSSTSELIMPSSLSILESRCIIAIIKESSFSIICYMFCASIVLQ